MLKTTECLHPPWIITRNGLIYSRVCQEDWVSVRKFQKREGFQDQLQPAVSLTIKVSSLSASRFPLFPPLPPRSSIIVREVLRENIARLAEFVIKSNGDGQTRARIVTSNRIILRHGDPVSLSIPPPPASSISTRLGHVSRLAYYYLSLPPSPFSVSDLQNSLVPVGATALN